MKIFTTCVGYADFLDLTLSEWKSRGDVHVITKIGDRATLDVCEKHGVQPFVSIGWYRDGAEFNKGGALDDTIPRVARPGAPIVIFDADSYPIGQIPDRVDTHTIFGCRRFECATQGDFHHKLQHPSLALPEVTTTSYRPELVRGFFQMFQYRDGMKFGRKRDTTFSGCDLYVASQFERNHRLRLDEFYVLNLGETKVNWKGRVTPPWNP